MTEAMRPALSHPVRLQPHETLDKEFLSLAEIGKNSQRKKQQVEKGLDGLSYFERCKLTEDGITNPEKVSGKIREAFSKHPGWKDGEGELRELRKQGTFAVCSEEDDLEKVAVTVASLSGL